MLRKILKNVMKNTSQIISSDIIEDYQLFTSTSIEITIITTSEFDTIFINTN